MGLINIYNTISNEHTELNKNGKLKDILPNYDFSKSVILSAGNKLDADYEVKENDVIYIRAIPKGAVVAVIAVVVAVVAVGVSVGAALNAQAQAQQAKEAAEKAQRDANNLAQKTQQLPFIKGAKNKTALGNPLQFIMGNTLNTPYLLTDGYYSIDGSDGSKQYWNAILCCGYGKQAIKDVSIGNVKVKTFNDGIIPEGVFSFDSGNTYYDAANKIEIRQLTDFTSDEFTRKVISVNDGSEIKHDYGKASEPLIKELAKNTKKVEVCIQFPALRKYNSNGGYWESRAVQVNPYWSNDNGSTWHLFNFSGVSNNTFSRNVKSTIRFTAIKEFTYDESYGKDILIKLDRTTPQMESNSNEEVYLLYYNSFCYDAQKSYNAHELIDCKPLEDWYKGKTTRIGIRIVANDSTKDTLDEINLTSIGVARTWNGSTWSESKTPTRNPAAWILELLTSSVHPHSKYSDDELDLASFGALYEYCATNEFYTDGILTASAKKSDIISKILQTVFADMVIDTDGKLSVIIDKKETTPVALINAENVRSIKVAKSFERKPDGMKLNFTNRDGWQTDTLYSMLDGEERSIEDVLIETTIEYATDSKHVYKIGQRKLRQQALQPREVEADVGKEGDYYPMYSTVMLQLKELKQGILSSSITKLYVYDAHIVGFELADYVNFENGKTYGVIVQAQNNNGIKHYYKVITGSGKTKNVTLDDPISITDNITPQKRNIVSFGYVNNDGSFTSITNVMKITGIKPNGDEGYTLTLKDYNESIYEYGTIPEYKTNLTSTPQPFKVLSDVEFSELVKPIKDAIDAKETGENIGNPNAPSSLVAKAEENKIVLSCALVGNGLENSLQGFEWQVKKNDSSEWAAVTGNEYYFNRSVDGYPESEDFSTWQFRARTKSIYQKYSEWETCSVNTDNYGTWKLNQPVVNVRVSDRTITLLMAQPARTDNKTVYGTLMHKVQVKRPDIDTEFYKPNESGNPYPELNLNGTIAQGNEENYKIAGDTGFVKCFTTYSQTMALKGQATNDIVDTLFMFNIIATNESGNTSTATIINATALCTNIRDIVKANETAKSAYISMLSALSANIGTIYQGAFGENNNLWDLSTFIDDNGHTHYEGKMRVGGTNQYLSVMPILNNGVPTGEYTITFKVGNFEISSNSSNINGELIIQENANSFDRTRITPIGTYYEHRDTLSGSWYIIDQMTTSGAKAPAYLADNQIVIGNSSQINTRKNGHDIGRQYLSNNGIVYHFDNNYLDQNGESNGLEITGIYSLKGREDSNGIDFTPAIMAVAPYSSIAKSIYGQFKLSKTLQNIANATIDFWLQYLYAESQELIKIGTNDDKIAINVKQDEPIAVVSDICKWENGSDAIYTKNRNPKLDEKVYSSKSDAESETGSIGIVADFTQDEETFVTNSISVNNTTYLFTSGNPDMNFETFAPESEWGSSSVLVNRAVLGAVEVTHIGQTKNEKVLLSDIGIEFKEYGWYHLAVVLDNNKIKLLIQDKELSFNRYGTNTDDCTALINTDEKSIIIDELYFDTVAQQTSDFILNTSQKRPFAALSDSENWFIFDAQDVTKVKSNILDAMLTSDAFKNAVRAIINE